MQIIGRLVTHLETITTTTHVHTFLDLSKIYSFRGKFNLQFLFGKVP